MNHSIIIEPISTSWEWRRNVSILVKIMEDERTRGNYPKREHLRRGMLRHQFLWRLNVGAKARSEGHIVNFFFKTWKICCSICTILRKSSTSANNLRILATVVYPKIVTRLFLEWSWIEVPNMRVISEITSNYYYSVTPVGDYSQPRAQLLLSHIHVYMCMHFFFSNFKHHELCCYSIKINIDCSVGMNNFVAYQHLILSEFNRSWILSNEFLPIVVTLQVPQDTFN